VTGSLLDKKKENYSLLG